MTRRPKPITKLIDRQQTEVAQAEGVAIGEVAGQQQVIDSLAVIAAATPTRTVGDALADIITEHPLP